MIFLNRTVFDIPLTWNRIRFETMKNKYRIARKLIEISINVQFEKQMRNGFSHNMEIEENIIELNERLWKCQEKLRVLDNMIELASQSLRMYFDKRMESVRTIVQEHCNFIQQIISEEAEHWKEIHAVMEQNLLNPGDIRSRNNYPRTVQKSPASNIDTIEEEEDDDEEHTTKLLNGQTLTPIITKMIRKSRLQSKRMTIVPSIKIHLPTEQENSIPRKCEQFNMHIIPLSTTRQPLKIVDTTFVIKPEDMIIDGDNEPNGTYRAINQRYHSQIMIHPSEVSLIDSQPNIPARLCFSPTILQEPTTSIGDNVNEQSSYENDERFRTMLVPMDRNRRNVSRRFGQTFLLDNVKTEQIDNQHHNYIRPAIPDNDIIVILDTNSVESKSHITHNHSSQIQQTMSTVSETVASKSQSRIPKKTKSKPVIVSARKTRSATKIIAEREAAATTIKQSIENSSENKRKTRKRKPSKSLDRPIDTSDEENIPSHSTHTITTRRKTKKRRKSKTDYHPSEILNDNLVSNNIKRKETRSRKTKQIKERNLSNDENEKQTNSTQRKKTEISTNNYEEKQTKIKKRRQKIKKIQDDNNEHSISSTKRNNHRSN